MNAALAVNESSRITAVLEDLAEACAGLSAEEFAAVAAHRGRIEQAKGMLMGIYGIDADAAFECLKRLSQDTNVRIRFLAPQLIAELSTLTVNHPMNVRPACDDALISMHDRLRHAPARAEDSTTSSPPIPRMRRDRASFRQK